MSIDIFSQANATFSHRCQTMVDPADIWPALVSGRARVVASGNTDAHHYLRLVRIETTTRAKGLNARRIRMLERVLLGDAPKVVAADSGCATSTVASAVGDCLNAMGLDRRCSRIPLLLVLMLHALRGKAQRVPFRVERRAGQLEDWQLVSSARLELSLSRRLSAGELAVARLLVEGKSHLEIAQHRGSAMRTVANQIASIYHKLGISGRIDLLRYLAAAAPLIP